MILLNLLFGRNLCKPLKISALQNFYATKPTEGHNPDLWQSYTAWHLEHIQKLEQAFKPYMNEAYQVIK